MPERSVFRHEHGRIVATEFARGPWDPNAQHGGAPAALLARAFESLTDDGDRLVFARLTFELLRSVPLGPLEVHAEIVRPGRRVQLFEGSIWTPDGVEVVRARALRVHVADIGAATAEIPAPIGPEQAVASDQVAPFRPMFAPDAIEIRFASGQFSARGRSTAWFRLRVPLVLGEEASPLQRLAAAADFPNGISAPLSFTEWMFINPDLTIHLDRPPAGEWFCLDAQTIIASGGIGTAEAVIFDERGRVGRATQALLVARRPPVT